MTPPYCPGTGGSVATLQLHDALEAARRLLYRSNTRSFAWARSSAGNVGWSTRVLHGSYGWPGRTGGFGLRPEPPRLTRRLDGSALVTVTDPVIDVWWHTALW